MEVKKHEITSGPSLIKKYWTLYNDQGEDMGSIARGHMFEIGSLCTSGYIVRGRSFDLKIYSTMWDAVTKGLGIEGTISEINEICDLFFEQGFQLAF